MDQPAPRTVIAIFDEPARADRAAADLIAAGVAPEDVSIALRHADPADPADQVGAEGTPEDRGALAGISIGAVIGGAAGLVSLAIPGVGPLIAAGPLAAVLGGLAAGGAIGGLAGSLIGLGVHEAHAHRYTSDLQSGGILLAVHTQPPAVAGIRQMLTDAGARTVEDYSAAETSPPPEPPRGNR